MTTLSTEPIYVDLGGRLREIRFSVNTAILLRAAGYETKPMSERIGVDGAGKPRYRVELEAFRVYLWAALQKDARAAGEKLTIEDVGELVSDAEISEIFAKLNRALLRFYGQEPKAEGEAKAAAAEGGSSSRGRSKRGSVSSAAS